MGLGDKYRKRDTEKQMKKHMGFIDTAKSVGIFLICLGHCLPSGTMLKVALYSFHVPVFFFIAGLLNAKPIVSFEQYSNKQKSLLVRTLIPYTIWFAFTLGCYHLKNEPLALTKLASAFLFLDGMMITNEPLWFLPSYFIVISVFRLICMWTCGRRKYLSLCCVAAFGCTVLMEKAGVAVPFLGADKGVHMLGYTLLGCICSDMIKKEASERQNALKYLVAFSTAIVIAAWINNQNNISILYLDYNEICIFIPVACVLCISFLISCSLAPESYIINLLAKNTCFIMTTHYFPLFVVKAFLGTLTVLSGMVSAILIMGIYIVFLAMIDKKLKTAKFKKYFTYMGMQF